MPDQWDDQSQLDLLPPPSSVDCLGGDSSTSLSCEEFQTTISVTDRIGLGKFTADRIEIAHAACANDGQILLW